MITETSRCCLGPTVLEHGIRCSSRRETVALAVDGVRLTAPEGASVERLDLGVRAKAPRIPERLLWLKTPENRVLQFESLRGETFPSLGLQHRPRIERQADRPPSVRPKGGSLVVSPDRSGGPLGPRENIRAKVERWNQVRAAKRPPKRVAMWAKRLEVDHAGDVLVRSQQRRWASYDAADTSGSTGASSSPRSGWSTTSSPTIWSISSTATTRRTSGGARARRSRTTNNGGRVCG